MVNFAEGSPDPEAHWGRQKGAGAFNTSQMAFRRPGAPRHDRSRVTFNIPNVKNLLYDQGMIRRPLICAVLAWLWLFAPAPAPAAELVMVEQPACEWCEVWDDEVGVVYSKTAEGRIAPLRRIDIHDPMPRDLEFIRGLVFTPTFVLVDKGTEIGRILGYPGEDFFWGLLQKLMEKLPDEPAQGHAPARHRPERPANAAIRE